MLVVGGESHLYLLASGGNLAEATADKQPEKKKKTHSLPEKANSLPCLRWMANFYHFQGFYQDAWSHKAASLGVVQNGWHWR